MKKCVVFDVDRTLVDSYKIEYLSLKEAIQNGIGINLSEEEFKRITVLPTNDFFKSLGFDDNQIAVINKEWAKTFKKYQTKCFNNIKDVIKELYNDDYILGIITSRTKEEFHELDEEFKDIINLFRVIVTSDMIDNHKPNRESMDYLCNNLNMKTQDIIYVGDSIVDKEFAINSECLFIPAVWDNKELLDSNNACHDPQDLIKIIKETK